MRRHHHHHHPRPHRHHHVHPPPVIHVSVPTPPIVRHTPAVTTVVHHHDTLADRPSVRVYCRARPDLSLTVRDGYVVLASSVPSDPYQHWVKDDKYSNRVRDDEGFPAFSLVNKATGQAIKHPIGPAHPVHLLHYNPDLLDESILWTESHELGDTYKAIRMVNNVRLNLEALHEGFLHGGVHDGTKVGVKDWTAGDNQRWRITYYCKTLSLLS
ncbi:hypothetical protein Leryth_019385 [Lithospermum erythrorhizon]|nr:hypothetical protein Leryth_019385 [Lithospermum erythrorhizon]